MTRPNSASPTPDLNDTLTAHARLHLKLTLTLLHPLSLVVPVPNQATEPLGGRDSLASPALPQRLTLECHYSLWGLRIL